MRMAPRSKASSSSGSERKVDDDNDEAYRVKRDRNNVAVKKSREKSRRKACETSDRVALLRDENAELEERVGELANELALLKKTLLARVGGRRSGEPTTARKASEEEKPAFADPRTVRRDHGYTGRECSARDATNSDSLL